MLRVRLPSSLLQTPPVCIRQLWQPALCLLTVQITVTTQFKSVLGASNDRPLKMQPAPETRRLLLAEAQTDAGLISHGWM